MTIPSLPQNTHRPGYADWAINLTPYGLLSKLEFIARPGPSSVSVRMLFRIITVLYLFATLSSASAAETEPIPEGHSVHGEAFNEGPRQSAYLMGGTGNVHFPVSTHAQLAQQLFDQGLGQLHGFWYFEAERTFRQVAALDADCTMAYWGMALANVNNRPRAREFMDQAIQRRELASPREQAYVDAWSPFFAKKWDKDKKKRDRGKKLIEGLEAIVMDFPEEIEAKAFLAVTLWQHRSQVPLASHVAVDALLQDVLDRNPNHPCHHYRIHLWDKKSPSHALRSAARCGQAAPSIAHMWHMPGHTYSGLHRYADAVWQQEASARTDHAHMMRDRLMPDQIHNYAHNNEWLIRNWIKLGRAQDALALAKNLCELPQHPQFNTFDGDRTGSAVYGRRRLWQVCESFELWNELLALAGSPYLHPGDSISRQIENHRRLGRAAYLAGRPEIGPGTSAVSAGLAGRTRARKTCPGISDKPVR